MISVLVETGDIPFWYDICFADDIRLAHNVNGYYIIFSQSGNLSYGNAVYHITQVIYH